MTVHVLGRLVVGVFGGAGVGAWAWLLLAAAKAGRR